MINNSKFIFIISSLFGWIMICAFGSNTVSFITNLKSALPFTDVESLVTKTDYFIVGFKNASIVKNFTVLILFFNL